VGDLREQSVVRSVLDKRFDEVYQLAADMGGAGYIFSGEHDADVMHNSATINLNVLEQAKLVRIGRIFYSSSACMYPAYNQEDPDNPKCSEDSAYPPRRTASTVGRNFSVNVCTFHIIATTGCRLGLPISQHLWPGRILDGREGKGLRLLFAEKWLKRERVVKSRFGVMESKRGHFSTLMSVLKECADW